MGYPPLKSSFGRRACQSAAWSGLRKPSSLHVQLLHLRVSRARPVIDSQVGGYPSETCAGWDKSAMQTFPARGQLIPAESRMTSAVLRQRDNSPNDEKGEGGARGKQERSHWENLATRERSCRVGFGVFPSPRPFPSLEGGPGQLNRPDMWGSREKPEPPSQPVGRLQWRNEPRALDPVDV